MRKAGIFYIISGVALIAANVAVAITLLMGKQVPVVSDVFFGGEGGVLDKNNALTLLLLLPLFGGLSYLCLSGLIFGLYLFDKAFGFRRPVKIVFTVASVLISALTGFMLLILGGAFSSSEGGGGFLLWLMTILFFIAMIFPLFLKNYRIPIGTLSVVGAFFAIGLALWFFLVNVFFGLLMFVSVIILVIGVIKGLFDAFMNKTPASDRPNYFLDRSSGSDGKSAPKDDVYRYARSSATYRVTREYADPVFGHDVCDKDVDITFYFENDAGKTITKTASCTMTGVGANETFTESQLEYRFGYMLGDIRK